MRKIKKLKISKVYDLQNSSRSSFYKKILFPNSNFNTWSSSETTLPKDTTKEEFDKKSVLERFDHQLQTSEINTNHTMLPDFSWSCSDISKIKSEYKLEKYIVLFPFCSPHLSQKKWPYYNELIEKIKRQYKDHIIEKISFKDSKNINYFDADKVGKIIIDRFEKKEFDVCAIFYNQFKNVITQIPQEQQIIPLKSNEEKETSSNDSYEFEPEEDEILSNLLPKNISTQIFKAMLENSASEQGSRMTAMDNATRNAGEMVDKLTIQYNRSRQAAITKELIEIISGAESL